MRFCEIILMLPRLATGAAAGEILRPESDETASRLQAGNARSVAS